MSHLDYSNSVLIGCPDVVIKKYQHIQNMCAKLVLSRSKYSSSSQSLFFFFFEKFLADTCPFLAPLVPLFWISGDVSSGFQSQSGLPYSHCGGEHNVHSPRSTSGATLVNLLVASAQLVLSPHTVAEVRLPGFELVLSEYL